jgi:hypothetical protein
MDSARVCRDAAGAEVDAAVVSLAPLNEMTPAIIAPAASIAAVTATGNQRRGDFCCAGGIGCGV